MQSLDAGCKDAELVVESVVEDVDVKRNLFKKLEVLTNDNCVLATNTSSLSIRQITEHIG